MITRNTEEKICKQQYKKNPPKNFEELSMLWMQSKKARLKQSSFLQYQHICKHYLFPQLGTLKLSEFDTQIFDRAMEHIFYQTSEKPLSVSTMKSILYVTKAILKYGMLTNYCSSVAVTFELPFVSVPEIVTLNENQEKALVQALLASQSSNHLGILIALYTGMRIGEICGIKKADVDLENSILHIRRTTQRLKTEENGKTKLVTNSPKSQKSYRDIPIPPFLSDILKSYGIQELSESQYILGKKDVPYEPRTLQYAFGRILRDCNIPAMKFHCLRHTFATKCIQSGFDVKTLS